jgi:DNA polymerase
VLAWLAGQADLVQGFADNRDVYSEFATKLFRARVRKPRETDPLPIKKLLSLRRGFGKDTILGCGYGMGGLKFYQNCRANPDLRPLFDSGQYDFGFVSGLIKLYRYMYGSIPKFWQRIEKMFRIVAQFPHEVFMFDTPMGTMTRATLGLWNDRGTVNVQLPSGRVLYYPHAAISKGSNRLHYQHGDLWGGSICENLVSAIARDLLAYWILECEKAGHAVVLHVHDEIVATSADIQAEENLASMMQIMRSGPSWAEGIPLAAEGCISKTYKK